ncbi:MAG: PAS domain-containing protein [Candidatus Omnitrophica bacterium]|nr:PAS domain-containing protein [Candidatus Omnitrophota bacterium]
MPLESPELCEVVLEASPCGCVVLDRHGVVQAANSAALKLLAVESSQLMDRPIWDAVPAWRETQLAKLANGATEASSALALDQEFELPLPDDRCLHVSLVSLPHANGQPEAVAMALVDATELVKLKQRLRWSEYQASIGKLARGIAHELNNPLDGVLRYTYLALEQLTADSPVREYIVHVKEGLDRMVKSVKAFLEFARQASMPIRRYASLNDLVDDALLLVHHRVRFSQIRIVKALDPSLPLVIDGGLQHAVVNLVKNALDAMPRGGTLRMQTQRVDGMVELELEDTGCGIPESIQGRVFEPFFSTKPLHQGSGLGLTIAKEVMERSGGGIEFRSQVGVGTTFWIRVPVASVEAAHHGT